MPQIKSAADPAVDATLDGALDATLDPSSVSVLAATLDGRSDPGLRADVSLKPVVELSDQEMLATTFEGSQISLNTALKAGAFPVKRWDRYEFIKLLGRGGMGAVYKARDKRLGRMVALKFIHSENPETTARFLQEARAQARIDHPNVCKVHEVGEVEAKAYIAMQFVDGESLAQAAQRMTLPEKVRTMKRVAEAMHEAHRLGIIHRDPTLIFPVEKPSSNMLAE